MNKTIDPLSLLGQLLTTLRPSAIDLARAREREKERVRKRSVEEKLKTAERMRKNRSKKK